MTQDSLIKVFYLLGNILYNRFKSRIHDPAQWVISIYNFFQKKYFTFYSFPQKIIDEILKKSGFNGFCDNTLIIHSNVLALSWFRVIFTNFNEQFYRNVQILFSPTLPPKTIFCSDVLLFNIKQSLSILPFDNLFLELYINPIKEPVSFKIAKELKTSQIETHQDFETIVLEQAIECFLKKKLYCYKNDILSINLDVYSPFKINKNVYFSIVDLLGDTANYDNDGFIISKETSVYQCNNIQSMIPSITFEVLDNSNISSLTTALPLGFENHYKILSRWFHPFFRNSIKELKPVFVLSGASGVGKKVLLEGVARKLGVHYCIVDCNDLISSSSAQIQANFKSAFNRIKKSGPSIVEFCNIELMCYECDSNDTCQMLSVLSEHVSSMEQCCHPSVFVITCEDFISLPERLAGLVLAHHHIPLPNDRERADMIVWLSQHYNTYLSSDVMEYLVSETASFTLADLRRLLALADLQRYKVNRKLLEIQDFTTGLEGMSKVERANVGEIDWEDVGGIEDIKKAVLSSIETGRLGGLRRTGLLLYGPPGTGKTLLARAVANQVSAAFIPVKGPELLNMYIGQSEANVRQVFSRARDAAPCILFFDELDSLAPSRGNQSSGGVMDRVVSQLLSEMDCLEVKDDVFVLAATNRPDLIDPALLRPGRLDKMIYVGPFKQKDAKLKVLKAITRKFTLEDNFDHDEVVELLPAEVTGAQLNAVCYEAWMDSARQIIKNGLVPEDTQVVVNMENFQSAVKSTNVNF